MRSSKKFDKQRAIHILLDADREGEVSAAKKWNISRQSIYAYRKRLANDEDAIAALAKLRAEVEEGWKQARQRCLRDGIEKLRQLIAEATVKQLDDVSKAIERIGNLDITHQALIVNDTSTGNSADTEPTEGSRRYTESATEATGSRIALQ